MRLCGVDPTQAMVDMANARRKFSRIDERPDLRLGSVYPLPWKDNEFDAVAAVHSFQFWEDPKTATTEIRRVMKPGGRLILILRHHRDPAPHWLPNPISKSGDEFNQLLSLLSDTGFQPVTAAGQAGSSKAILAIA